MKLSQLFLLPIAAITILSCNTVHKVYSKSETKLDSISTVKSSEVASSKNDSSTAHEEQGSYSKKVTKEYIPVLVHDTVNHRDTIVYVRKVTSYERASYRYKDTASKSNSDTSSKNMNATSEVKKQDKTIDKDKKSSRVPALAIAGVALLLVIVAGGYLYYKTHRI